MSRIAPVAGAVLDIQVPLVVIGGGAAGLCAALAAKEAGVEPLVIERDKVPSGSTALSAGLIPAAGTGFQRAKGIVDSSDRFATDIQRKAHDEADQSIVETVTREAGVTIEWLAHRYQFPFDVIHDFNYPGHSAHRMHGLPTRSGQELIDRLRSSVDASGISIITERIAETLFTDAEGMVRGVEIVAPHGRRERIGCDALVLACNGYGGNPDLVRRYIPEMANALYFGHPGNRGDAVMWGAALGAELSDLGAYQGHGSVATPHNILISWATIMQGGIQVNCDGLRFCDETQGYSEQAAQVLRQPDGFVWTVFDGRIAAVARQFEDFQAAEKQGAILRANTIEELANAIRVPVASLAATWNDVEALKARNGRDRFGRVFAADQSCAPPYHAVKVTGALFHTQGGLAIDTACRVRRASGDVFPNLFAAGGAAAGVSGATAAGYLSGNGLLTATVLGRLAGQSAAKLLNAIKA